MSLSVILEDLDGRREFIGNQSYRRNSSTRMLLRDFKMESCSITRAQIQGSVAS